MTLAELQGKKIAIAGLGVNNQGLVDYFREKNIKFETLEWESWPELDEKLQPFEVLFRTPGLPYASLPITRALNRGILVYSQTKLFFDLCPCPIIGITGTKGKGTTANLVYQILKQGGRKVWLAGNVGRDPFDFLDELVSDDLVVLELSSFQLQDLHKSPKYAVVLNITPDHLNHHKDISEYVEAKSNILRHQSRTDFAVLSKQLPRWFAKLGAARKLFFDPDEVARMPSRLLGKHNWHNVAAAYTVAKIFEVDENTIKRVIAEFPPLPHRLNPIRKFKNILIVDDAFSTNIESTMAAIDSFDQPVILIVGGYDKGLDFGALGKKILSSPHIKALIVIGQVAPKIISAVAGYRGQIANGDRSLSEIVRQAMLMAAAGDVVLFSPGTSSFDMFKNEADRGEQFEQIVNQL
ncbi:MAG: UDP-N-acetylmuramoyl-L-alanine--D-glutamate ligase [Candidatus Doudnabacteria bacterium]|nr:UDP-N-acetylmuramoyl-L-alanine--D-glutamate ligase [Candidatus Doudnabacteria bacterium]